MSNKEAIVKFIVNECPGSVFEERIHRIVYLMDVYSICKKGMRVTNIDFCPFMYGMYSEELSDVIESIDFSTKKGLNDMIIVDKYIYPKKSFDLDSETENTLRRVLNMTSNFTKEDLDNWSKETELYKETEYGTVADWSTVNQSICQKDIDKLNNY